MNRSARVDQEAAKVQLSVLNGFEFSLDVGAPSDVTGTISSLIHLCPHQQKPSSLIKHTPLPQHLLSSDIVTSFNNNKHL